MCLKLWSLKMWEKNFYRASRLVWSLTKNLFSCRQVKRQCEHPVGALARSCQACYNSKQKCEGAVWGTTVGLIGGPKETEVGEKGSLAEVVRVLASKVGPIRGILDIGLMEMADAMSRLMADH